MIQGIPGTVSFLDDITVTGNSKEEHLKSLKEVFTRLENAGLRLNEKKCSFFQDEILYLGFKISKEGLSKTDERIVSILEAPAPINVSEIRAFCGMINNYSKFIKNYATILSPLYNLLKKDVRFDWSMECQTAFDTIKEAITSDVVLVHFDPELPVILTCDASDKGLGAVLAHRFPNRDEKPISLNSRALTKEEKNYSVIQKEALAIVFACKKLYQYLWGRPFILKTDHKPLVAIFGEKTGIPQMAASRMQRCF